MSNLILNNNNYYFKSDAISVYPCAYRGATDSGKFFDPASRYTSEKNITGAAVGLVPNGTYISDIPLEIPDGKTAAIWKFTIGGYNFEAQLDATDLSTLTQSDKVVKFEIEPEVLPNDATEDTQDKLTSLGKVLTSYEASDDTAAQLSILDREIAVDGSGSYYCFTGLKVTVVAVDTTTAEKAREALQPTSRHLIPVICDESALVLNQYARLPEITHGVLAGEAEVTKLNVLENITLADADAKNLLVEDQFIVGTSRDTEVVLKVTLDRDQSTGNTGTPSIEVRTAPVTIYTDTDEATTKALSVTGGAEIKKSLTVSGGTTTETLSVANGKFEVDNAGGTTIKNNLTVKDSTGTNNKFTVDSSTGNTVITGELHIGPTTPYLLSVTSGTTTVNTSDFKAKNVAVEAETNSTSSTTGALVVEGGVGIHKDLNVAGSLSAGNITSNNTSEETVIRGSLSVTGSGTISKFSVDDAETIITTGKTLIASNTTGIAGTLEVTGDLTINVDTETNTSKFSVDAESGNTAVAGTLDVADDLTVLDAETNTSTFSVDADTGNTNIAGTLNVNGESVNLVGDTVTIGISQATIKTATQIEKTLTTQETLTANGGVTTTALTVTGTGDKAVNITNGGLFIKGKIASNGALEVSEAVTAQALNIKPGATAQSVTVINSSRNLQNIAQATVGGLYIKSSGKTTNLELASLNNKGELTAKSVKANVLHVPNCDASGKFVGNDVAKPYTTLSLGPEVPNDGMTTRSFYFDGIEYTSTPAAAKAQLLGMIYPTGSIYMTMEDLTEDRIGITENGVVKFAIFDPAGVDPKKVSPAGGLWKQISQGRVLIGQGSGTDANSKTVSFNVGGTGSGYYNPQPWEHWHKYKRAYQTTEDTALSTNQMPRHTHYATTKQAGFHVHDINLTGTTHDRDVSKCDCIRVAATTDGAAITYKTKKLTTYQGQGNGIRVWDSGSHAHSVTVNLTGGDTTSTSAGKGIGHKHAIGLVETDTIGNPTTSSTNGNLPPYLVCYIWQRIG